MKVTFELNIKLIVIILFVVGFLLFGYWTYTRVTANRRSIQGIVNYLNKQAQPKPEQIPQPKKEEGKEEGK